MFFPVSEPYLGDRERELLLEAFDSGWISSKGSFIKKFEDEFARYCHRSYGVSVGNGTLAIHLALLALGVGPGDEVLVPSFTFIASVNPIRHVGATPVFVEVDKKTLTVDVEDFKKKITPKTKAAIMVPLYGHSVDYDPLLILCDEHNIHVVEDAAEAHGSKYKGKRVGKFGDLSCFSFYGNKIITTGEGGIILTDNESLYEKMKILKNHGMSPNQKYEHPIVGYNFRMTNLQAAIGCAQLEKIETILAKRREINEQYEFHLKEIVDTGKIVFQPRAEWAELNHWFFSILLVQPEKRDQLMQALQEKGIDSRPFFSPIHKQACYTDYAHLEFPVTELLSKQGINLPTHPGLESKDIALISSILKKILNSSNF
jgi:perosamine synthetase